MCSIDGISGSNMLAEDGNKALWHNFDVLDPKILVIKLDFVFSALTCMKQNGGKMTNFAERKTCV